MDIRGESSPCVPSRVSLDSKWGKQFTVASSVYYITSTMWPARETFLDAAILPDDVVREWSDARESEEDLEKTSLDKTAVRAEVKSALSEHGVASS